MACIGGGQPLGLTLNINPYIFAYELALESWVGVWSIDGLLY